MIESRKLEDILIEIYPHRLSVMVRVQILLPYMTDSYGFSVHSSFSAGLGQMDWNIYASRCRVHIRIGRQIATTSAVAQTQNRTSLIDEIGFLGEPYNYYSSKIPEMIPMFLCLNCERCCFLICWIKCLIVRLQIGDLPRITWESMLLNYWLADIIEKNKTYKTLNPKDNNWKIMHDALEKKLSICATPKW